ncbi:hypothetical protein XA68_18549 [Ophiocordyceps unilateralis]|uniref:Uncharacterized protein n=1 Tax=Ophiocordyceps unilateralis TaxID=268505 RepID=A0A2A9PHS1_OPHUN|nr:hypothetical protein XA68_18549 [Ophiocordyceps unilateralis]
MSLLEEKALSRAETFKLEMAASVWVNESSAFMVSSTSSYARDNVALPDPAAGGRGSPAFGAEIRQAGQD